MPDIRHLGARRLKRRKRAQRAQKQSLSRRALKLLAEPLDPTLISERETRDGRFVQYIEGSAAIRQANRIFGPGAWGAEVIGEVAFRPMKLIDPVTESEAAVGMYAATVSVSIRNCSSRSDVGCSFVAEETPEAHEVAYKGAVTDALKRALRHFGVQFGLELRSNDRQAAEASRNELPVSAGRLEEMRRKVVHLSARLGYDEAKARSWTEERYGQRLEELSEEQLADAVRFLADQNNRRNGGRRRAA